MIVSNLTVETSRRHWNWWGSAELLQAGAEEADAGVAARRHPRHRPGPTSSRRSAGTSTIVGHAERPIENIRFSNVDVTMLPEDAVDKRATHALVFENASGVQLRDLSVRWTEEGAEPKWQSALALRNVTDFEIDGFRGRPGHAASDTAVIVLDGARRGAIRNPLATEGSRRLVHVSGGRRIGASTSAAAVCPPARRW